MYVSQFQPALLRMYILKKKKEKRKCKVLSTKVRYVNEFLSTRIVDNYYVGM